MNIPRHLKIFFFKSHVRAYTTKHGVFVAAHEDKRQKRAVPGHKRVENQDGTDLFSAPAAPVADKVKKPTTRDLGKSRLDAFIKKHHGLPNLAHHIGQMTDAERQRIYTEMGKIGNKTPTEVSLMFRGVKPASAVQEDLFGAGKEKVKGVNLPKSHKTAHNEHQLPSLDTLYAATESRPGTTTAQRQAGHDAFSSLQKRLQRLGNNRGRASLLGARLAQGFVETGGNQLTGQKITSSADLAALAQVYRDPRFETFRAIYVRNGEVVAEAAYSSRLPGAVQLPDNYAAQIRADKIRFGADGYYMLHNHPSGQSMPSDSDLRFTDQLWGAVPGLQSHVVIDHHEYSVINPSASPKVRTVQDKALAGPDYHNSPSLDHPLLGVKIGDPKDIALAAKAFQANGLLDKSPVMVLTKGFYGEVDLIASVPLSILPGYGEKTARAQAWLRGVGRASGAGGHSFLCVSQADYDDRKDSLVWLVRQKVFTDVISPNGNSLLDEGAYTSRLAKPVFDPRSPGRRVSLKVPPVKPAETPPSNSGSGGKPPGKPPVATGGEEDKDDFLKSPDGSIDFGEITAEQAKAIKRQAGKIRLQQGDDSYGARHIELRHGKDIRAMGFKSIADFVSAIAKNIDQVWKPSATAQLVAVRNAGNDRVMFVELQQGTNNAGDYYTVRSAFPARAGFVKNKKWELLWEGRAQPSSDSGSSVPFAVPLPSISGDAATIPSGQSSHSSVGDKTGKIKAPSVAKNQPAAKEADDEEAVFEASMSTKQKQDMYGHLVRDKMISAPSFPALFAAAKSYVKSTGKDRGVDYVKKRLDDLEKKATDNPWDLLVMHTFLWNAKSARAQTLQTLAFKKQRCAGKCAA